VPSQAGSGGLNNTGSVLYYGLIDAMNPLTYTVGLATIDSCRADQVLIDVLTPSCTAGPVYGDHDPFPLQ
jgi:hypothetical protein